MLFAIFAFATLLAVGTIAINPDEHNVLAKKKSNNSTQDLSQDQLTGQSSEVLSENGSSTASGNNIDLSFNLNQGHNALGQQ